MASLSGDCSALPGATIVPTTIRRLATKGNPTSRPSDAASNMSTIGTCRPVETTSTSVKSDPKDGIFTREDNPLDEFIKVLESNRRIAAVDGRSFILTNRLLEWFRSPPNTSPLGTNAGLLLMAIYPDDMHHFVDTLVQSMGDESPHRWLKIFAILLQLGKASLIHKFYCARLRDRRLPLTKDALRQTWCDFEVPNDEVESLTNRFRTLQCELSAMDALDEAYGSEYNFETTILPFMFMDPGRPTAQGSLGSIYEVAVPVECIPRKLQWKIKENPFKGIDPPGEYHQFALKVLRNSRFYAQETAAYQALEANKDVVQCLGFWSFVNADRQTEYHVLLEWANYDLYDFFKLYPSPNTANSIIQLWKHLSSLVNGLRKLHNIEILNAGRAPVRYHGWHGDIKPANILYCEQGQHVGWKIGDPGFATFKLEFQADTGKEGLLLTRLHGGTDTYGGPERYQAPSTLITQRFDIWSLGCVFLEVATWAVFGYRGVTQFRWVRKLGQHRRDANEYESLEKAGPDFFHDGVQMSEAVQDWLLYIRNGVKKCDPITESILDMIQSSMLVGEPERRSSADNIFRLMNELTISAEARVNDYRPKPYFWDAFEREQYEEA